MTSNTVSPRARLYLCAARAATVFGVAMAALASCHASDEVWQPHPAETNDAPLAAEGAS
ncbi:hypothetical protein [Luteibacter sp. CQ10]|uniref:hypothetical protein n=1 Tax=Luteibacter sp. CQ10 TaxID=2805821 RepID=UPI0034A45EC6